MATTAVATGPLVPIIRSQSIRSWPHHDTGGRVPYVPLSVALTSSYETDAHVAGYSVPAIERRLALDAVKLPEAREELGGRVTMVLALFDIDRHGNDDVETWWVTERAKLDRLVSAHAGGFIYRTRGGYRIVYTLPSVEIASAEDAAKWTRRYLAWCVYMARRFDVDCDPACSEWVRLYRLPHATREGSNAPEDLETIGDSCNVGLWWPELTELDWAVGGTLRKKKTTERAPKIGNYAAVGDGVLFNAFRARGWVGRAIDAGKWSVRCPWERQHSKGEAFNTSTILYAPGAGESLGWFHCSHAHCQGRDAKEVLREFSDWEIERAEGRVGMRRAE